MSAYQRLAAAASSRVFQWPWEPPLRATFTVNQITNVCSAIGANEERFIMDQRRRQMAVWRRPIQKPVLLALAGRKAIRTLRAETSSSFDTSEFFGLYA